jgi:hypothetical protein
MQASDCIALSSVEIALCALGISVWQGYVAREHNELSILPLLHVDKEAREGNDIELVVINHGLGPAIIIDF